MTIEIVSGNGDFAIRSSGPGVATANISGNTITINAVSSGSATLTIEDPADKSGTLEISASSGLQDTGSPRFVWDGTIALDKANN